MTKGVGRGGAVAGEILFGGGKVITLSWRESYRTLRPFSDEGGQPAG
jgi:hypothetical protein